MKAGCVVAAGISLATEDEAVSCKLLSAWRTLTLLRRMGWHSSVTSWPQRKCEYSEYHWRHLQVTAVNGYLQVTAVNGHI